MFDENKLSRGDFLGIIGGMALTAVLLEFSGAKKTLAAVNKTSGSAAPVPSTYGNSTYGGRRA
jgi:hypothetical protein